MNLLIDHRICGIPCLIRVTDYSPADPGCRNYDYLCEPSPAEVEYDILDRRGREAPWLARKLKDDSLDQEIIDIIENNQPRRRRRRML
jgi:hypothetical protein